MNRISSWGCLSSLPHKLIPLFDRCNSHLLLSNQSQAGLAYGMGRSYGDVCLNPNGLLWLTGNLNKFISFDDKTGRLICESGVLLSEINALFAAQGWMLPVLPGTEQVTVGGAIANDIHGKNHHIYGTFAHHVHKIKLLRTTGEEIICGPNLHSDWFNATVAGLGLTGLIVTAEIQLKRIDSSFLTVETYSYDNFEQFLHLSLASETDWEYTVSWVNASAKNKNQGIFMRAKHENSTDLATFKKNLHAIPIRPPISLINNATIPVFNRLYFYLNSRAAKNRRMHYRPFLCPLDGIANWNRLYGTRGFYQHQSLVPLDDGLETIQAMLDTISQSKENSCLSVLKTFGNKPSLGLMSFVQPGLSLAIDFPNKGASTLKLLDNLDDIVKQAGGRLYLAKDSRMSADFFTQSYPNHTHFLTFKDPGISSAMSRRLMGQ